MTPWSWAINLAEACWRSNYKWKRSIVQQFGFDLISTAKPTRCTNVSNIFIFERHSTYFGRSFRPSSGVQDCTYSNRHLSNRYCCLFASWYEVELCLIPTIKQTAVSLWHMPVAVCTILNYWWWTEKPSETCRVSFHNEVEEIQQDATECRYLFTAKLFYMFRASIAPIIRSTERPKYVV